MENAQNTEFPIADKQLFVSCNGKVNELLIRNGQITFRGRPIRYSLKRLGRNRYTLLLDEHHYEVALVSSTNEEYSLQVNGKSFDVFVGDERSRLRNSLKKRTQTLGGVLEMRSPMPGFVSKVEVSVGDHVTQGQGLLVLEAMKMENEIRSPRKGKVGSIKIESGKSVEKGELLLTLISE